MKILAFVDLHSSVTALRRVEALIKKEKPDVVVNAGDFTVFEQNIEDVCRKLAKLHPRQLVVHGNHEEDSVTALMCKRHGWTFLHKKSVLIDGVTFLGYGGGGFSTTEPAFAAWVKKHPPSGKSVFVTHQPCYGAAVDNKFGDHVGNKTFTAFIKRYTPVLAISGHIHETAGKVGKVGRTTVANPGPFGKVFTV